MAVAVRTLELLLLLALFSAPAAAAVPHAQATETQAVVRVWTRDATVLTELSDRLDLWSYDPRAGVALVRVSPAERAALLARGLRVEVDPERTAALLHPRRSVPGQQAGIPGFPCYRTVEETYASLQGIAQAHPGLAVWTDIGDSWEKVHGPGAGYDLQALVLTNSAVPGPKFPFIVYAAMHARELATAELATRFAEAVVAGYGVDPDVTWLLDYGEIHVIAQANPDGRKRAESGELWRKNVDNDFCTGTSSRGIDLNRNSTFFWGGPFSSSSACSETFRGPSAASEPETAAIEDYLGQVFEDQRGDPLSEPPPDTATGLFISLHSFGGFVLFPWEGVTDAAPNKPKLETLGRKFGYLDGYLACQDGLPPASGTTVDQAYGEYGVAAYTIEIGNDFFESCSAFENTVLPANMPVLFYAAKAARRPYQEPAGPEVLGAAASPGTVAAGEPVTLTGTADDTRYDSHGCGTEPVQAVAGASYTIDQPPWLAASTFPLVAADGTFDSSAEALTGTVDTSALAPGRHLVYLFATDADGNRGVPSAAFLTIGGSSVLFSDGFESGDVSAWSAAVGN